MIRFKQFITEKWVDTIKNQHWGASQMDIFVNPSTDDFDGIRNFRWCAFPGSKNLYMAQAEVLHVDIGRTARRTAGEKGDSIYGTGYTGKDGKKHYDFISDETLFPSDEGYYMETYYLGPKFFDYDWGFMKKWIPDFGAHLPSKEEVQKAFDEYEE